MTDHLDYGATEDRTMPAVAYALYLLGFVAGFTAVIGVILAYASQGSAGPLMRSHYTFLIRTFWLWFVWILIGFALVFWGGVFSLILVGLPFFALGWWILALVHTWFAVRAIVGVIYLSRDQAYPRPRSWLL